MVTYWYNPHADTHEHIITGISDQPISDSTLLIAYVYNFIDYTNKWEPSPEQKGWVRVGKYQRDSELYTFGKFNTKWKENTLALQVPVMAH